jgi:hypothetical protein
MGAPSRAVMFASNSRFGRIGDAAFAQSGIVSIVFPCSITLISTKTFCQCNTLARVEFEANSALQRIGRKAFMHHPIVALTLPERTISIETMAFFRCTKPG